MRIKFECIKLVKRYNINQRIKQNKMSTTPLGQVQEAIK